jgi:hypothetical protein
MRKLLLVLGLSVVGAGAVAAQVPAMDTSALSPAQKAALRVASIQSSAPVVATLGDTVELRATALDAQGRVVDGARVLYTGGSTIGALVGGTRFHATKVGSSSLTAFVLRPPMPGQRPSRVTGTIAVTVRDLPVETVEILPLPGRAYIGTTLEAKARAMVAGGRPSADAQFAWSVTPARVATVNRLGQVTANAPGAATLTVRAGGKSASLPFTVSANPVTQVRITGGADSAKTGDVLRFTVAALNAQGRPVPGVVPLWSVFAEQTGDDAGARVWPDGGFVAEEAGIYTIVATVGGRSARTSVRVDARLAMRPVRLVGKAVQGEHSTSELHVWTARDGRDYAYVGTHAAGKRPDITGNVMFAYDVTDPTAPKLIDSVIVNARLINDILVNDEGTLGILTREGAADRKNGLVILDVSNPGHPKILSEFTDSLTAGIHNLWFNGNTVYATNDGTNALSIIDISDPRQAKYVGRWETGDPNNRYLHDVWVHDGIMYLSYWDDGVQILDVGGLHRGGTARNPVFVSKYSYPIGSTHNVWRVRNYLFVGDEIFGCPQCINGPRGYIHVVDLADIDHPVEVGKFEVPEAGVHNMWAEGDKLYVAYYNGGIRVIDIAGELRGDLYRQGRQVGFFYPVDEHAFVANTPMTWGPQLHKGNIFASDMNSGLWVVRVDETAPAIP